MPVDRAYQDAIDYLYNLQKHGIKLALANSVRLMGVMGDPHRKFRTIHVAGTNGKGSTSAFIAGMLRAAGYRVGLYTSPHLVSFTERIRINGVPIPEDRVVELAQRVRDGHRGLANDDGSGPMSPTFFEVTTAIAFTYFAEEGVDVAVIEVGMGGRLDSTNVILPLVSVITTIDLEHTEFLGETLPEIAAEKAGIIKPGVPVVTGVVQPEVISVIELTAMAQGAPVYRMSADFTAENVALGASPAFDYRGSTAAYRGLRINLIGRHQVDNACVAVAAIECLRKAGMAVGEREIYRGLDATRWEGRLERVESRPDIYLDGAHNPASARTLAVALRDLKKAYRRLILVIGILGDKDYRGILAELVPLAELTLATKPQYARALDARTLATEVRSLSASCDTTESLAEALIRARRTAAPDDVIVITGSLYVVGDARALLAAGPRALTGLKG